MTARWMRPSVRVSLTLWYGAAMVIVLAIYAIAVYAFVSRRASQALDTRLRGDLRWVSEMAHQNPDGSLIWYEGDDGSGEESPWLQVWSTGGQLLLGSRLATVAPIPDSARLASSADSRIHTVPLAMATFRILSARSTIGGRPVVIQVAASEANYQREMHALVLILVLGLPIGVAAAGLGGYVLARRALAPVDRMAERARHITAERLSERLAVDNPNDELGRLASVFNETLGTLEWSFDQMRNFTSNVSHQLRTPLTALRTVGEVGLRAPRDEAAYRTIIGSMLEEVDRLALLVDRLLALSRAESRPGRMASDVVDLGSLAEEVNGHLRVLAEEKQQVMTMDVAGAPQCVGDRQVLRQALINLVDNAIKYTPVAGHISIRVAESPAGAVVDVSDTGPGIAEEPRARIFDRFYRADPSSSRDVGGAGLGLSIARWAVEVCGGQLTLERSSQAGSTFRITLPQVPPSVAARHA